MKNSYYYYYQTILGMITIECIDNKITYLGYGKTKRNGTKENIVFLEKAFCELKEYLKGTRKYFDLPMNLEGTEFQKKVWKELLKIPYGEVKSYQEIAEALGDKKKARAVGMANNKNPIAILVPCHRVIGKNHKLIGYGGGLEIQQKLLEIEKVKIDR